jgi:hypothetical protein
MKPNQHLSVMFVDYEELRPFVLEALRVLIKNRHLTLELIIDETDSTARSRGFYKDVKPYSFSGYGSGSEKYMPSNDREKVRQIVWEFILQGILAIGRDEANPNFPFVSITEHGKKILESGETLPYDPDGFLRKLKTDIPNLDPIVEMYVTESLQAYLKGLMFSSAVALGVASEQAFLLLLETFTNAIKDPSTKSSFEKLQDTIRTKHKFDQLKNKLMGIRVTLPRELSEDLESQFDGIFNLIRVTRNDAGHPTGRKIERDVAFVNLRLFIVYCKKIYGLIDYFGSHPI